MSIMAKKLGARKLFAEAIETAAGAVKTIEVNSVVNSPDGDGNVDIGNIAQIIKVNGTQTNIGTDGIADVGNVCKIIKVNGTQTNITTTGIADVGNVCKSISVCGTSTAIGTDGIATVGNVCKSYKVNSTTTNVGTNGLVDIGNVVQTFNGSSGAITGVSSVNGSTGAITGVVKSVNGTTPDGNGAITLPTISGATVSRNANLSFTWAQASTGALNGCLGDICMGDSTINLTGNRSLSTSYSLTINTILCGKLTIRADSNNTESRSVRFDGITGGVVELIYMSSAGYIFDAYWNPQITIFNAPSFYTASGAGTLTSAISQRNGGTVVMNDPIWEVSSSYKYQTLYILSNASELISINGHEDASNASMYCATLTPGCKFSTSATPGLGITLPTTAKSAVNGVQIK
jgi:hypothetical protein